MPNNLITLGDSAFENCTSLSSIAIPSTVINAFQPFAGCSNLNTIKFADGLQQIPSKLFENCNALLNNLTFPSTFKTIGNYAFYNCINITSFSVPQTVTTIEDYAFANNTL